MDERTIKMLGALAVIDSRLEKVITIEANKGSSILDASAVILGELIAGLQGVTQLLALHISTEHEKREHGI